ncbi:MAG: glycoside hydrolase family 3 C-terminal domain-containing protein [Verrucomicrobiota bacterium]
MLLLLSAAGAPAQIFRDPDRPLAERIDDLICQLSLEEKVGQMEEIVQPIPRLGITGYSWWSECIHGVGRAGRATVFPAAIGLAATWDLDLMARVGTVISDEARAKHPEAPAERHHGLTYWAPAVDLVRDPRWGRIEETYGEDPFLVGQMGLTLVKALQGDDPIYLKIAATPKHFAVHSQETDRHAKLFDVSERVLRDYYLAPFRACFVEGKAASVMTAYNGFNSIPSTANRWLLTDLLRGEWGFDGAVVTDWGAPRHLRMSFKIVATDEDAVAAALRAGVDVLCQHDSCPLVGIRDGLLGATQRGIIDERELDAALRRSLKVRFRLGMFDPPERVLYEQLTPAIVGTPEKIALAREASQKAIVLLKNAAVPGCAAPTPLLPIDRQKIDSIAVIGSHANRLFLGNYSGDPAKPAVTTYQGITNHVPDRLIIRHVPWVEIDDKKKKDAPLDEQKLSLASALKAAADSDVAVVVLGLGPKIEMEGRDRQDLDLPKDQQQFIEKVVAVNPATVVVLINGGPLAINWIHQHVPAIVEAWYPGQEGGNAIADVLFGDFNPAGRLPITFYAGLAQLPPLDDYDITIGRTYMYLRDPPLYPFGHGLSYTSFEYRNLRITREGEAPAEPPGRIGSAGASPSPVAGTIDTLNITLDVANTGPRDGAEVVQLYVRELNAPQPSPLKKLRAFQRIHIPANATHPVTFTLNIADLAHWDVSQQAFVVTPGEFEILVGASSADIRGRQPFRVK